MWSFVHLNDAARATVLALDHEGPAVYNIVDDEPAPTSVWLPELARVLGAKRPAHYPRWLARVFAGEAPVVMATESRGASNAKAKGSWAGCSVPELATRIRRVVRMTRERRPRGAPQAGSSPSAE